MQKTKIFNREYDSVMITTLNLENRCIKELPKEIGDFMNLEILRLCNNNLTTIPKEIVKLTKLMALDLRSNKLKELPKEIGNLTNLKYLYLTHNFLTLIPLEITKLKKLEYLTLNHNKIKNIQTELLKIKDISILSIDDSSYDIDNLDLDTEIIILNKTNKDLLNLPFGLKKIYFCQEFKKEIHKFNIKLPFGCVIEFFTPVVFL